MLLLKSVLTIKYDFTFPHLPPFTTASIVGIGTYTLIRIEVITDSANTAAAAAATLPRTAADTSLERNDRNKIPIRIIIA